jgi:hypothetical protein
LAILAGIIVSLYVVCILGKRIQMKLPIQAPRAESSIVGERQGGAAAMQQLQGGGLCALNKKAK